MKSTIYTYEFLKRHEIVKSKRATADHGYYGEGITLMFPVDIPDKTKGLWATKCLCGNYFTCQPSDVYHARIKSCGCHIKRRNRLKYTLETVLWSIKRNYTLGSLPSEYKSRDIKLKCNTCEVATDKGNLTEHLIGNRLFCRCGKTYKRSFSEVKHDCEEYLRENPESPWSIESYPEEEFTSVKDVRISLKCNICSHEVDMLFGNFVRGKGCQGCSDIALKKRISKDLSYFLEKSYETHGDRYDYSKVVYTKCREPVEIVCKEHGSFWQSPDNHYNKGKGCRKCNGNRYVNFKRVSVEDNKDFLKSKDSGVYVLKSNLVEDLYKIGISVVPERRCKDVSSESKLDFEVFHYKPLDMYNAYILENNLHTAYDSLNCRDDFDNKFAGYTECFILEEQDLTDVVKLIDNYKEG